MTSTATVNTVLGPVLTDELGLIAVHERLLSVLPGAQYAYDIDLDRSEMFAVIAESLRVFKAAGGGTVVDAGGMFAGRDVPLLEAVSRAVGVHIVASTGQMEEGMLGGYFLTPQTNPPAPWPAEKFDVLYGEEVTQGMVVPRVERRGPAGLVSTAITTSGMTATDESQLRGCARAALRTGVPLTFRAGADPVQELSVVLGEGLRADRIAVAGAGAAAPEVAARGAYVVLTDQVEIAAISADHPERVLVATGGATVAFGYEEKEMPRTACDGVLTRAPEELRTQLLGSNPVAFLTVQGSMS